jgi:hypothetical protein
MTQSSLGENFRSKTFTTTDALVIIALFFAAGLSAYLYATQTVAVRTIHNVWFSADCELVYQLMTDPAADSYRRVRHPLYPILAPAFTKAFQIIASTTPDKAVSLFLAAIASLWISSIYVLMRLLGCRVIDAAIVTLLGGVSAASFAWLIVPESYALGSLTITIGLIFALSVETRTFKWLSYIILNLVTLSVTVTNWMVGILVTLLTKPLKDALKIFAAALVIISLLMISYRVLRPHIYQSTTHIHHTDDVTSDLLYENMSDTASMPSRSAKTNTNEPRLYKMLALDFFFINSPMSNAKSLFFHSILFPSVLKNNDGNLSVQDSPPGSGSNLGLAGVALWILIMSIGFASFMTHKGQFKFRIVVGGVLIGQICLHLVFGDEAFLFTIHILPLFLIIVAYGLLSPFRIPVFALTAVLVVIVFGNNAVQLSYAIKLLEGTLTSPFRL